MLLKGCSSEATQCSDTPIASMNSRKTDIAIDLFLAFGVVGVLPAGTERRESV